MAKKYYAVKSGRKTGIFGTWDECKAQVSGYSGAIYKSFKTKEEAEAFIGGAEASSEVPIKKGKEKAVEAGEKEELKHEGAVAYVDGSYNIRTKEFSYGMIVLIDGKEYKYAGKDNDSELASMRNVAGEIKGAEAAMRFAVAKGLESITIYHDYEGIARWCTGEWKTNKEGTKAYKKYYDEAKEKTSIKFVKVKGHSNDKYNDIADELAKQALGICGEIHNLDERDF